MKAKLPLSIQEGCKMEKIKVLLQTESEIQFVEVPGLLAVGGPSSSGTRVESLKSAEDYAVLSIGDGVLNVHALKGKKLGALTLKPFEQASILDLTIVPISVPAQEGLNHKPKESSYLEEISRVFSLVANEADLFPVFNRVLSSLLQTLSVEKGFIVAKTMDEEFEIVANEGVNATDPWLSESLLAETLKTQNPLFVQNVVGSHFENNRSLISTGFLSVFTWPLRLRGQVLGALVVGSTKPHSGLSESETRAAAVYSQLAAYVLSVHIKDKKLREQVEALKKTRDQNDDPFLTTSPQLKKVCEMAKKIAPTELSVLIQGETGVGKEVLARWIHSKSEVAKGLFVAVNCGAIPENLIESVLFGHKKGSFTGALADQIGKFQFANNGTLFLDEIGDLPQTVQVKLLRALQERVVEPIGSNKPLPVNVRVVAASHKNLLDLVSKGKFREDLYYRLAEITLEIPPLRERREDIGLITSQYLTEQNSSKRLSALAWEWIKAQTWSGNVRELLSHLKRASILAASDEIEIADFNYGVREQGALKEFSWLGGSNLEEASQKFLSEKVQMALRLSGGNRKAAAELLGITPRTLFRYLEEMRGSMTDLSV
jgi:DNA-binding NtrC family response regulator